MKCWISSWVLLAAATVVSAQPIVIIVRHAEKLVHGGNDPDLSQAGAARAEALAHMMKDAGITAIFTSELKRTQETAAPLAKALGITPTVVPAKDTAALVQKLHALADNALVVGHGNTIPDVVKSLGMDAHTYIGEDDYSEVFVISLGQKPQLLRLHYPQ